MPPRDEDRTPPQKNMTTGKTNSLLIAWASLTSLAACFAVGWIILDQRANPTTTTETHTSIIEKREPTLGYWNAMIVLDGEANQKLAKTLQQLAASPPEQVVQDLATLASAADDLTNEGELKVAKIPMLGVDEELLRFVRDECDLNREIVDHLAGMSQALLQLQQWQRSNAPQEGDDWANFFNAFIQGFLGNPLGGYEEAKAKAERLNAEASQMTQAFIRHQEGWEACVKRAKKASITEMELRAKLAAKYGVEFPPRPDPITASSQQ